MFPFGQNFTRKSQEAILRAQGIAQQYNQPQIDTTHLLLSLLSQIDSIVLTVCQKLGIDIESLKKDVQKEIGKISNTKQTNYSATQFYLTQDLAQVLEKAKQEAIKMGDDFISVEHFFLALLSISTRAKEILTRVKYLNSKNSLATKNTPLTYKEVLKILNEVRGDSKITDANPESKYQIIKKYTINLTDQASQGKLDPVIGREKEIRRLIQILSRRKKNNPALIGDAGVGKTAIVEGLAQKIVKGDVPESLKNRQLISLDLGALIAGTKFRGEFEDRIKSLLKEINKLKDTYILFIDELHTIVGAGSAEGAIDASNLLKPALARGELKTIGATTIKEYQKYIEKDSALERRFQPIYVAEPNFEDTVLILKGIKERYELHHGVKIQDSTLITAVKLSQRYISDRFLPDKAVDLIDEACSFLRLQLESEPVEIENKKKLYQKLEIEKQALKKEKIKNSLISKKFKAVIREIADLKEEIKGLEMRWRQEKDIIDKIRLLKKEIDLIRNESTIAQRQSNLQKVAEIKYEKIPNLIKNLRFAERKLVKLQKNRPFLREEVIPEDVATIVSIWTGIPVTRLMEQEAKKLIKMEQFLEKRVIGQMQAIKAISNAIRRSKAGIGEEQRPIGSFLFLGPSGVGKTELTKALALFLFNDENSLIRIDMSEYMEKHSISKLIGSPPGYVGYDESGQLTEKIRRRPYAIVLFDEIEKAHLEISNLLLQILEDGHLTDAKGRRVSFKNTVIIMTSNVDSTIISKMNDLGFSSSSGISKVLSQKEKMQAKITQALKEHFKPEFLNRIDDIIIFNYLTKQEIKKIVELRMAEVFERLKNKNIKLRISDKIKTLLIEKGFDLNFGARPLKRAIQQLILNPISLKIISKEIQSGESVFVDTDKKSIIIKKQEKGIAFNFNINQELISNSLK